MEITFISGASNFRQNHFSIRTFIVQFYIYISSAERKQKPYCANNRHQYIRCSCSNNWKRWKIVRTRNMFSSYFIEFRLLFFWQQKPKNDFRLSILWKSIQVTVVPFIDKEIDGNERNEQEKKNENKKCDWLRTFTSFDYRSFGSSALALNHATFSLLSAIHRTLNRIIEIAQIKFWMRTAYSLVGTIFFVFYFCFHFSTHRHSDLLAHSDGNKTFFFLLLTPARLDARR